MIPSPVRLLLAALVLAAPLLTGCGEDEDSTTTIRPGPVAEFRRDALSRAHAVDTEIAALEAQITNEDSASAAAIQAVLDELLDARHLLQLGLNSLDTLTTDDFNTTTDSLSEQLESLENRVERAPFELVRDAQGIRAVAAARHEALDEEIEALRAGADSTLTAELDSLHVRNIEASGHSETTSDTDLDQLREQSIQSLREIRRSLDSLRVRMTLESAPADSTNGP